MQTLKRKIKLEIIGAGLIIEDADISLEIKKTDDTKDVNTCEIVIYNVSDDVFNKIKDFTTDVRAYTDIDGSGYTLSFDGTLRNAKKVKKSKAKKSKKAPSVKEQPQVKREFEDNDIATTIYLEDGRKNVSFNNYITKSYTGPVTNRTILNDILSYVKKNNGNIKISADTSTLDEYTYPNGATFSDTLKSVLVSVCNTGNAYCTVQNDVILISSDNINKQNVSYAYLLNGYNCPRPEVDSENIVNIQAPFISSINPFDFVLLDFEDYKGLYRVKQIESKMDNFGQNYESNLKVKAVK